MINLDLSRLKNWGSHNLMSFNAGKTQCCLISRRVDRRFSPGGGVFLAYIFFPKQTEPPQSGQGLSAPLTAS